MREKEKSSGIFQANTKIIESQNVPSCTASTRIIKSNLVLQEGPPKHKRSLSCSSSGPGPQPWGACSTTTGIRCSKHREQAGRHSKAASKDQSLRGGLLTEVNLGPTTESPLEGPERLWGSC